jgi:GTP-binding protein
VNRLSGSRKAVVDETPGVTRDRNEVPTEWNGRELVLVDTGGVDAADPSHMQGQVAEQARQAVEEADLVLLVIDARAGLVAGDEELADILRRSRRPVVVVANKVDDPQGEAAAYEFHRLGLGDPVAVSAMHGHATGDLLDAIVAALPGEGPEEVGEDAIRVAILGRPNVGKSSLLNALYPGLDLRIGEISEKWGTGRHTTRAALLVPLAGGGYVVDTPGLREVGTWGLDPELLALCFPEFRRFLDHCRFDDCRHLAEPGCAVREAAAQHVVEPDRLESYQRVYDEINVPSWSSGRRRAR